MINIPHILLFVLLTVFFYSSENYAKTLDLETDEATWMALDLSPDGKTIVFDILGDIYLLESQGGKATQLLTGNAFDTQAVFSPDGKQIAFISDRSGSNNLWLANIDGSGLKQLSFDDGMMIYTSPSWSPDGQNIYVSKARYSVLAFEVFVYNKHGGSGIAITQAQPNGTENFEQRLNALGAISSPNGQYLYYAKKVGTTWTDSPLPHWSLVRRDLQTGAESTIINAAGGAMRPALSHDGQQLAYASRYGLNTGLRVRNLQSGQDKWLAFPIDNDGQEGGYYADLVPRFTFTPDDKAIVISIGGKIRKIELVDGKQSDIPFVANMQLELGQQTRVQQVQEKGTVKARIIQSPRLSPDQKSIVFSALGRLYIQELKNGASPRLLKNAGLGSFQPSWSPDGKHIVYVSWSALKGGHIWTLSVKGNARPQQLTQHADYYSHPAYTADANMIVALRANQHERMHRENEIRHDVVQDIINIPLTTEAKNTYPSVVARVNGVQNLYVDKSANRVRFYDDKGLNSINLDGTDLRQQLLVSALSPNQYFPVALPVENLKLSPNGEWALAKAASQLYLVSVPNVNGNIPELNIASPKAAQKQLTQVGVDDFEWADDGKSISWSLGSSLYRISLDKIDFNQPGIAENVAKHFDIKVEIERDIPKGKLLLRGAMAITMQGDQVIENSDILIVDNRIVAVGQAGTLTIPSGTTVKDVTGKFIIPGFVDTHAHWFDIQRGIVDTHSQWDFLANLAYGVTAGLDVQTFTNDTLIYQDMIDSGMLIGPRTYSTGPGIFVNSNIDSEEAATKVLKRYKDYYRTRNIKSYMLGDRAQRQFLLAASRKMGMMPTTEGATNLTLNLTHALDGYAGNEHNLPVSPLYKDILSLYAKSRIAYTPTFTVLYGGWPALDDMIARHQPQDDPKLQRFMPPYVLESKTRVRQRWSRPQDQSYPRFATDALKIQRAGGLIGMGSHGEMQGIGYHWEMEAYASGGASPMEVLRAATINSSEVIGRSQELGSLEAGKFADLLILDKNPLDDIQHTQSISSVMKNGRLYEAATLNEIWPRQKPLANQWFWHEAPLKIPAQNSNK